MGTFVQVLEGSSVEKATLVAQITDPNAVRVVMESLARYLADGRWVQTPTGKKQRDWMGELGMTLQEWCKKNGLSYSALTSRMRRGQAFEDAVQALKAQKARKQ